jgi:hypothetical protein
MATIQAPSWLMGKAKFFPLFQKADTQKQWYFHIKKSSTKNM